MKRLTLPFCLAAFVIILATPPVKTASSTGQVTVRPGDNIQAVVAAHPPGTSFVITPGTYRLQSIRPKDGDTFTGQPGAILNGARILDTFKQQGQYWVADVTVNALNSYRGECDKQHPACMYPEDLFYDSKPLTRVESLSEVAPGQWFLDYNAGKAYTGSDPSGHTVEISITPAAFWGSASNVTIQGLAIEKYASIAGKGAINAMAALNGYGPVGKGWVVESNDIYFNHGLGVRASDGMTVRNNKIHDNGQMGVAGSGSNILVQGNEVYGNNYAGYAFDWEAGGVKFAAYSTHVTLDNNYVHDNKGPGLHGDIGCDYFVFENNHTARNISSGIHWEISYHAIIRNNLIEDEGYSPLGTSFWYGGGILVSNSTDVDVYGNTVKDCVNGIGGTETDRGADKKTGVTYDLKNLYVHNNTITQQTGFAAGIVKSSKLDNSVFTSWNNRFINNTYHLGSKTGKFFEWSNSPQTLAAWLRLVERH